MAVAISGLRSLANISPAMMSIMQKAGQPVLSGAQSYANTGTSGNAFQAPRPVNFASRVQAIAPAATQVAAPPPVSQPTSAATGVLAPNPRPAAPPVAAAPRNPFSLSSNSSSYGEFSPQKNLIAKQIQAPSAAANNYDQQAAQYAQQANVGDYSGETAQARQMILKQLQNLQSAPDRFQLAQNAYKTFQEQSEPQYQQALRGVGQKAAALGRVGAGMTTNDLTGVLGQRNLQLGGERERLINNALENTMGDRLNVSNALQSGGGLLGGQDLSLNQARSNAALNQANLFSGMGQNQFGREFAGTQQQVQQQQYQSGLDQQNIQNQIAQQQLQQGAQQQGWAQQFAQQQLAAQIAAQQNTAYPTGGYAGAGINSGQLGYQGY